MYWVFDAPGVVGVGYSQPQYFAIHHHPIYTTWRHGDHQARCVGLALFTDMISSEYISPLYIKELLQTEGITHVGSFCRLWNYMQRTSQNLIRNIAICWAICGRQHCERLKAQMRRERGRERE